MKIISYDVNSLNDDVMPTYSDDVIFRALGLFFVLKEVEKETATLKKTGQL